MELDSIDKYIHMTKLANGVEVMFGGQPCLKITEGIDSYSWAIYPVFAKLTYGASIFEDVPYCNENFDTMEEAIADGLAKLHSLGAFVGEVDLPEDTYAESGVNESVEELDESVAKFKQKVNQAFNSSASGNHKNAKMHLDNARSFLFGLKSTETGKVADEYKTYKNLRKKYSELSEETLDSILKDCRAYATKHSNSIMEAHDLSVGLYKSVLDEVAESFQIDEATKALSGDAYWKAKEAEEKEAKARAARADAGIKEPEKRGRGKPTLGATVEEMKDRMRENIAAGKRPHTGFDRNEKLRILRSGAMEHPEFAGTHVKAAGRPHGTTKAAAAEKKKAEPTAFSMWAGLGKK